MLLEVFIHEFLEFYGQSSGFQRLSGSFFSRWLWWKKFLKLIHIYLVAGLCLHFKSGDAKRLVGCMF